MTTYTQALNAMRSRLEAGFTALPISWGNDDFDPQSSAPNGWLYVLIGLMHGSQASIGTPLQNIHRDGGQMHVWVFVPRGALVGTVEAYAEQVRDLFTDPAMSSAGIRISSRHIGEGGHDGQDGRWYGLPVVIAFNYDRTE